MKILSPRFFPVFVAVSGLLATVSPVWAGPPLTLNAARQGFKSAVTAPGEKGDAVETAPARLFRTITYPAQPGPLAAYVSPDPGDGKKHPAIVWITGGDCNSIGDVWSPASPRNDQTAAAYRRAGIVMLFPSLRGGNRNPGVKEGFLGEVNDVLAAARYLEKLPYVDPARIYLGGHSTGGTLALLVAESSSRFRAVFSFGPVASVDGYGQDSGFLPFDITQRKEVIVRSPGYWLGSVRSPVFVIEGAAGTSNVESLRLMAQISKNPRIHFIPVPNQDHFSVLGPVNAVLAKKVVADTGAVSRLSLTREEAIAGTKGR